MKSHTRSTNDQNNPATQAAQEVRLREALLQLREELRARALYRVVDPGPTQPLQDKLRAQQEFSIAATTAPRRLDNNSASISS